ncbi:hypothetical protein SKA58_06385 [Sphingomonas sp. SKA58]|nr:hypothetical protein SKA58_06385 [Sphingomonas sp. SKA58]
MKAKVDTIEMRQAFAFCELATLKVTLRFQNGVHLVRI